MDISLREVTAPGARRPRRITPKSLSVLLVLVANAGKVVSRDALLAQVWPDTLPGDDVVTQAITLLRKAFNELRESPQYIETIAKSGYRLLAEVEWLDDSVETATAPAPGLVPDAASAREFFQVDAAKTPAVPSLLAPVAVTAGEPRRDRADDTPVAVRGNPGVILGVLVLVAVLVAALVWWTWPSREGATSLATQSSPSRYQLETRLITSAPGFEFSPTLSPDGGMVAYIAVPAGQRNIAIMVQPTAPTVPTQLTHPVGVADDHSPEWSPSGREIAFLRIVPGQSCHVLVVPATGGVERVVGTCDPSDPPGFDWTPDGRGLIFGGRGLVNGGAGLQVLNLASGEVQALEYDADPNHQDFAPRYSPDGRWIIFVRNSPLGDFWRLSATGGIAERLTRINAEIRGWDWSSTGRALIYGRRDHSSSGLYRYGLDTGAHTSLGVEDGEQPVTAANVSSLAYVVRRSYFGIYQFDLDAGSPGKRLFASSGRDRLPAIAPDGRQLVFTSDRSGKFGLWWAELDKPDSLRLIEGLQPESRYLPSWNADNRRVLVVGRSDDDQRPQENGVYEVIPKRGTVTRLPVPVAHPVQAVYLPASGGNDDERLLVLANGGEGHLGLYLYDRDEQPWRLTAFLDGVSSVQVDNANKLVVFSRPGERGLWQADFRLDADSVRAVDSLRSLAVSDRSWALAGDRGVYVRRRTARCPALLLGQATQQDGSQSGGAIVQSRCLDRDRRAATHGFSIDGSGRRLYITLAESDGGNIGFATFETPPETMWPGVIK
ncbi:winged helix-turn-helix domain-containing protein [Lysobacter sp. A286]